MRASLPGDEVSFFVYMEGSFRIQERPYRCAIDADETILFGFKILFCATPSFCNQKFFFKEKMFVATDRRHRRHRRLRFEN